MDEEILRGRTVLVAEDEYTIATDLKRELVRAGARVIGPVASLEWTLELIDATQHIDAAILDVNLQGEKVFPAADLLGIRGVPFLFATGYDESVIPTRFEDILRCEKPMEPHDLVRVVTEIVGRNPAPAGG